MRNERGGTSPVFFIIHSLKSTMQIPSKKKNPTKRMKSILISLMCLFALNIKSQNVDTSKITYKTVKVILQII